MQCHESEDEVLKYFIYKYGYNVKTQIYQEIHYTKTKGCGKYKGCHRFLYTNTYNPFNSFLFQLKVGFLYPFFSLQETHTLESYQS